MLYARIDFCLQSVQRKNFEEKRMTHASLNDWFILVEIHSYTYSIRIRISGFTV